MFLGRVVGRLWATRQAAGLAGRKLLLVRPETAAGKQADDYLKEKLFDPLGLKDWTWHRDDAGNTITYAELRMTARDLARVGQWILEGAGGTLKPETLALFSSPATPLCSSATPVLTPRSSPVTRPFARLIRSIA